MKTILHPFQFRFKRTLPSLTALLLCAAAARAQLLIDVGEVLLRPDEAGQAVQFFVENRGATPVNLSGLSLNLQVADSGPPSEGGLGTLDGPNISAVDLLTGAPFAANHTGPVNAGSIPQFANWTITTASSFVSLGAGTRVPLATITFDTRGFASGRWDLALGNTLNGPTKYFRIDGANVTDINPQIHDGTLRLLAPVPEPATATLACALALLAWTTWHRQRRAKKC